MHGKDNIPALFDRSGNLTLETLERYLRDELTPAERSTVEEHLDRNEFDREALEGLRKNMTPGLGEIVDGLNASIMEMAAGKSQAPVPPRAKSYYWAAAATLAVLAAVTAILVFQFGSDDVADQLALNAPPVTMQMEAEKMAAATVNEGEMKVGEGEELDEAMQYEQVPEARKDQISTDATTQEGTVLEEQEEALEIVIEYEADEAVAIEAPKPPLPLGGVEVKEFTGGTAARQKSEPAPALTMKGVQSGEAEALAEPDSIIFLVVEQMPQFPGGDTAFMRYLANNLHYPDSARIKGIQGRVFVTFVVEKDGTVSDVRVLRGIGSGCDDEAVRVIRAMPKWVPGVQRNQPVRVQYNLPIKFSMD